MTRASASRATAGRIAALLLSWCGGGCSGELPEAASPDAALYAAKCGSCHIPHHPHTLTPAMWKVQVVRMDAKYRSAGMPPPSGEERERILAYLSRHAGG